MRLFTALTKWVTQQEIRLIEKCRLLFAQGYKHRSGSENKWLPRQRVRMHLRIIGFSHATIGVILLWCSGKLCLLLESKREAWFRSPGDLLIIVGIPVGILLGLVAILILVTGIQLPRLKQWAYPVIIGFDCCLGLLSVTLLRPFVGLLLPIWLIWLFGSLGLVWLGYCAWVFNHRNTRAAFDKQGF